MKKKKRRYVKAEVITLVKDPVSGVLVVAEGGDLGANAEERQQRGEIVVTDRQISSGGMIIAKGAYVVSPGRIDRLILDGHFDPKGVVRKGGRGGDRTSVEEARKEARDAIYWLRDIIEKSRLRKRTIGLYQAAQDRGNPIAAQERADDASDRLAKIGRSIGWIYLNALMDAIAFEQPLSMKQEKIVIEGVFKLIDYRQIK